MTDQVTVKLSRTGTGPSFALLGDEDTLRVLVDIVGDYTGPLSDTANVIHKDLMRTLRALQALKGRIWEE